MTKTLPSWLYFRHLEVRYHILQDYTRSLVGGICYCKAWTPADACLSFNP